MQSPYPCVLAVLALLTCATKAAAQDAASPTTPKVSGFVQFTGSHDQSDLTGRAAGQDSTKTTFAFKRVRLKFAGKLSERAGYTVLIANEAGTPALFDAYMDHEFVKKLLSARVGQFKHPFGLEGPESGPSRPFIVYAELTDGIYKKLGTTGGSFRDMGVMLSGVYRPSFESLATIDYAFAVVNGSGPATTTGLKDNGNAKDYIGSIQLNLPPFALVGASGHYGEAQVQNQAFKQHERTLAVYTKIVIGKFRARAEYAAGLYQNAGGNRKDTHPLGWYAAAMYTLPRDIQAQVRYEDWRSNIHVAKSRLKTTTLGVNWQISKAINAKFNYLIRDAQANAAAPADGTKAAGTRIRNYSVFQLQYQF
ncbi:MAG: porin [Elusimicrobiota bacterium]